VQVFAYFKNKFEVSTFQTLISRLVMFVLIIS